MAVFSVPSSLPFHLLSFPTLLLLSVFTTPINALNRYTCQYPTQNPLSGCPPNTLLVGATAKYTTIQSAILSLPHNDYPYNILILPGNYTEQLNITRSGPVTLLGQTAFPTNLTKNSVNVVWHQATGTASTGTLDNAFTSTLTIAPTLNSSLTGSGPTGNTVPADTSFGNSDFRAYNLNFVNDYLPYSAGPSLALSVSYANAGFYYTGFYSYQDTIYIGKLGNAYFSRCEIAGQTDFLYGFGTAWIQSSRLSLRGCGGGITAWKGTNTTWVNKYGVYISESVVEKANSSLSIEGKCALGRPWNAQHRSIFSRCYLDDSIVPSGYIKWSATDPRFNFNTTMAEYHDYGPGFNLTGRLAANVTVLMTDRMWEPYSAPEKVFVYPGTNGREGNVGWIDFGV